MGISTSPKTNTSNVKNVDSIMRSEKITPIKMMKKGARYEKLITPSGVHERCAMRIDSSNDSFFLGLGGTLKSFAQILHNCSKYACCLGRISFLNSWYSLLAVAALMLFGFASRSISAEIFFP